MAVDAPYFIPDRLLDRQLRGPGWFATAEIQVLRPFLNPTMIVQTQAQADAGTQTLVNLPRATLNWTVSPRVVLGYRLASGFGELSVAYRQLGSSASTVAPFLDGPTALSSRVNFDMIDIDYSNSEPSLWPMWDMRWTVGPRFLILSFDSQVQQPFGQAAAGSGVLQERAFNNFWGVGPHGALQLARHLRRDPRWSLFLNADFATEFTDVHVGFRSTTIGPGGMPLATSVENKGHQGTPIINVQAGLAWQPSPASTTRFFLGYQYEHFWALNFVPGNGNFFDGNAPSLGQIEDQGIVIKATFRY